MLRERLTAQAISGRRLATAEEAVGRILAVQAQDGRGARLAVRARSRGLTAAEIDRALTERRSLVIATLNRGTLHLVRAEDYHWLHGLTLPQLATTNATRLAQEGLTPAAAERGVAALVAALAEEGPLPRATLRQRIKAAGVKTEGQAFAHLTLLASVRGLVLRGPVIEREAAFALVEDWLGPRPPRPERAVALAELARRYLAGHGPARPADLAKWAGIGLGEARSAFGAIAAELSERRDRLFDLAERPAPSRPPRLRLLGPFDPILHGWASRDFVMPPEHDPRAVTSNGIFRPTVLIGGRIAGVWKLRSGRVELDPFRPFSSAELAAVEREERAIRRFLALPD